MIQTRMDICVYVCGLQRNSKAPKAIHLKCLKRLIRYIQKNPHGLTYKKLKLPVRMIAIGDSAFQSQEVGDPLVMKGYAVALASVTEKDGLLHFDAQPLE